jgi:hypothetical protein
MKVSQSSRFLRTLRRLGWPVLPLLLVALPQAQAYYLQNLTGRVPAAGVYNLGLDLQFLTNSIDGTNIVASAETAISDESSVIARLGFGEVEFSLGGDFKWVPIPDVDNQPALGVAVGASFSRLEGDTDFTVRIAPFVGKTFALELGELTPWAALPYSLRNYAGDTDSPVQLALGSDWRTTQWRNLLFRLEYGSAIANAFNYLALGVTLEMDENEGFKIKKN